MKVYLAGKVKKHCWRHDVVKGLREALHCDVMSPWPELYHSIFNTHNYVGPYFASCDHGCNHGSNMHGNGLGRDWICGGDNPPERQTIIHRCFAAIKSADLVFAWIDSADCYGTIAELGYAAALNKQIKIAVSEDHVLAWDRWRKAGYDDMHGDIEDCPDPPVLADLWFPLMLGDRIVADNPVQGLAYAIFGRNTVEALQSVATVNV